MKNLLVLSTLLFISSIVFAQSPLNKGTYTVGGNISFSSYSQKNNSDNQNFLTVEPKLGYFFIDDFYTGTSLLLSYYSSGSYSSTTYGLGPIIRYYFDVENLKPFLGLEYVYSFMSNGDDSEKNTQTSFTMNAGIDYFITNYFALEGSINYSFINHDFTDGTGSSQLSSKLLNIGVGANYFIH